MLLSNFCCAGIDVCPQQILLNEALDIKYFEDEKAMLFLDSYISGSRSVNVLNIKVESIADDQNLPGFDFAAATLNSLCNGSN